MPQFPTPPDSNQIDWDAVNKEASAIADRHAAVHGFVDNAKQSALDFAGGVAHTVMNPFETAKTMGDLAVGVAGKLSGRPLDPNSNELVNRVGQHFKDRYGSLDAVKHTAYTDPVGFAADLSTVLGGVGGAAGGVSEGARLAGLGRTASTLGKVSDVATSAAEVGNPLMAAKNVGKAAEATGAATGLSKVEKAGQILQNPIEGTVPLAKKWYRASLKPLGTEQEGTEKVNTLLNEGVSPIGEQKAWNKINAYSQQIKDRLNSPQMAGETVNPSDILQDVEPLLKTESQGGLPGESFNVQVAPESDVRAVHNTVDEFMRKHFTPGTPGTPAGPPTSSGVLDAQGNAIMKPGTPAVAGTPPQEIPIPVLDAQAEKQGTYKMLSKKAFGTGQIAKEAVPVGSEQAQYALARGLRRTIAEAAAKRGIHDIHDINAMEGRLLDVMPELQRNAASFANSPSIKNLETIKLARAYAAMQAYKAGKLDFTTYTNALRQGVTAASQINEKTGPPVEEGGVRTQ